MPSRILISHFHENDYTNLWNLVVREKRKIWGVGCVHPFGEYTTEHLVFEYHTKTSIRVLYGKKMNHSTVLKLKLSEFASFCTTAKVLYTTNEILTSEYSAVWTHMTNQVTSHYCGFSNIDTANDLVKFSVNKNRACMELFFNDGYTKCYCDSFNAFAKLCKTFNVTFIKFW